MIRHFSTALTLCMVVVVTVPTTAIIYVGASTTATAATAASTSTKIHHTFHHRRHATNSRATIAGFCSNGGIQCNNRSRSGTNSLGDRGRITHGGHTSTRLSSNNRNSHFQYRASLLFSKKTKDDDVDRLIPHNNNENASENNQPQNHNWTSQTMAIALPALAGMMTDPLLSLVDTLFVGRLGHSSSSSAAANGVSIGGGSTSSIPLAALGACTSIFHLSFHCFRATTMSTSSLVAGALARDEQRKEQGANNDDANIDSSGAYNQKEAVLIAQTSIQQALITGAIITAFLLAFGPKCLIAMGIPSPASSLAGNNAVESQLYPSALTYLNHRSLAAPAVVVLSAAEGIFRGYGDVITPWKVSCVVALLNLVLDPFCMFGGRGSGGGIAGKVGGAMGLGMGIKGAAVATAFSQACGAILYGRWLFRKGLLGGGKKVRGTESGNAEHQKAALERRKRTIAIAILRANAAMMAKQGSLLLGWAYATSRATRMGHAVVASHQMALSVWLVVALVLEGAGVAAQVLMAKEWEGLKVLEEKREKIPASNAVAMDDDDDDDDVVLDVVPDSMQPAVDRKRRAIKSLTLYMLKLSIVQGLLGSLSVLLLRRWAPDFILTNDPAVRRNILVLLPHIAAQMALVSVTLVTEALAIGGGRFKWLAGGTTVSSVVAIVKLRGAVDLVDIWNGGIVALFVGRLVTASLAVMDMNGLFRRRERRQKKIDG